jgi:starvation-inducible DNA-binding protein
MRNRSSPDLIRGCRSTFLERNPAAIALRQAQGERSEGGPHFHDYHLLFDAQAAQIFATTDQIAERVRKTGNTTLRSIGDVARHQSIKDNDAAFVSPEDMIAELRDDNLKLVEKLREAKDIVDEAKDNATSGILDDWTDQAEERAWFLFETSRKS